MFPSRSGSPTGAAKTSHLFLLLMSASSAALLAHGGAKAAEAAPANDDKTTQLQEVVVTANRSGAQSLQSVAMAISAVDIKQFDRTGSTSITDLTKFTPSLVITEDAPGFNKFDMRGLTTGAYRTSDTSDRSLVAVYLDDTPISVQGQTPDLKVYDLERVEVLRGPQGTLYGAGSMSGTIRFITAKPNPNSTFGTLEVSGSGTEHGSGNYNVKGMINIPIIADSLAVRATVYQGEDSGYINNIGLRNKRDANLDRTTQARIAVRWTPTTKLTIDASATYEKSHAYGLNQAVSGLAPYTTSTNGPEGTQDDFQMYSVTGTYDLGFANLVSSSSYTSRRIGFQASYDAQIGYFFENDGYTSNGPSPNAYPLYNPPTAYSQTVADEIPAQLYLISNKIHDFMQEVRLVSKDDGPVKWTVGAYYEHQRRNLYQDDPTPGFDTLSYENAFGPYNTPNGLYNSKTVDGAFEANDVFSGVQNESEHQLALFTDDTWHVTKKLDITAGVRYFNFSESYYLFESGVYGVINHVPLIQHASLNSSGFNPRFNASYKFDKDFMVYAEAAKGFRYGGTNQPVPVGASGIALQCAQNLASYGYSSAPLTFGPDHLWSYTVGEKAKLFDGRMTLNADAYYVDWKDVQTRLLLNCTYFFTDNKGSITSRGLELESVFRLTHELTVSVSAAYNDSRANGNIPTVGAFDGQLSPYSPRYIAGVSLFYDRPVGDGQLHLQASYQFRGDEHTTFNPQATDISSGVLTATGPNELYAVIPSSVNVGLSAAYDIGRYEFGVFGTNLTNGVKITDIMPGTYYSLPYGTPYQDGNRVTYARPRTIGARVKVKF